MSNIPPNTICLWYNRDAEQAARFYAATFPDSFVGEVFRAPADFPSGKAGDVLTVRFTVLGIPCLGLNGGPAFAQSEAFSFQVCTENQEETDRYWNALVGNGGKQYRVAAGEKLKIEQIPAEVGAEITIDQILMVGEGETVKIGAPLVAGASVKATVLAQGRHDKVRIFKMRRRKHYQKRQGHRQNYTEIRIDGISA